MNKLSLFLVAIAIVVVGCRPSADTVVFGTIYTAEKDNPTAEAIAIKDGKYIYVGNKTGVQPFIKEGATQIIDHTEKGMIMPGCVNGHAHYLLGYGMSSIGTSIDEKADVSTFLQIVKEAAVKAHEQEHPAIIGFGWDYFAFIDRMPTRQQLDAICSDIPIYLADNEGHKGLANTLALVNAGIMDANGNVLLKGKDIRGGEIVMATDGTPTGLLLEQAGTYVRSQLPIDKLYTIEQVKQNLRDIQRRLLSEGYTIYMDGWSNYFYNNNAFIAAQQLDQTDSLHFILGMSYEMESWTNTEEGMKAAIATKQYGSKHVLPKWVKLFIDGTVESGTGFNSVFYPDGHQGLKNWDKDEVADITRQANANGLTMHIHTMGDSAVATAVDAYVQAGQDEKRNTVVHVFAVLPSTLKKMAEHNICADISIIWHHCAYDEQGDVLSFEGWVPKPFETEFYPIKSFFDYGINATSHSDFPALSDSPDDPFGIMEIAVTGKLPEDKVVWWPEELISREQALQALTINGAYQMHVEAERGSIMEGKYADFLLIDQDVLTCPEHEIHNTQVIKTYFEGKEVYSSK